jgi:hypothetical protein
MRDVWQALTDVGIDVVPVDAERIELGRDGHTTRARVLSFSRPLSPSDVADLVARHTEPGLLVVPAATAAVQRVIERVGWSWLVNGPHSVRGVLRLGELEVSIGDEKSAPGPPLSGRAGPVPWGSLTVVRRLLQEQIATQRALAAAAGLSQPRVSQTLTALTRDGLVSRRGGRWWVDDLDDLLRWWLDRYPGPGGITTFWYGLAPLRDQAQQVIDLLSTGAAPDSDAAGPPATAVVSGDLAADLLAPWRTPTRAVVYARCGADLGDVGLTPAGPQEATLELILPRDPGVWPLGPVGEALAGPRRVQTTGSAADHPRGHLPLADPVQVLWDVRRAPGPDSGEAADRLWTVLREYRRVRDDSAS